MGRGCVRLLLESAVKLFTQLGNAVGGTQAHRAADGMISFWIDVL